MQNRDFEKIIIIKNSFTRKDFIGKTTEGIAITAVLAVISVLG